MVSLPLLLTAVIAGAVCFALGLLTGRYWGIMSVFRVGLRVKNPEMWELLHYLVVDYDERKKEGEQITRPHRPPSSS